MAELQTSNDTRFGFLRMLAWPDAPDFARINLVFVPLVAAGGALLGSFLSAFILSGMVWAALQLLRPSLRTPLDRDASIIAACFALVFIAELISALANSAPHGTAKELFERLPFLFFLPVFQVLRAPPSLMRRMMERACLVAALITFAAGAAQFFVFNLRAADGAGNAGVFAVLALIVYAVTLLDAIRHSNQRRLIASLAAACAAGAVLLSGMRSLWPLVGVLPVLLYLIYGRRHAVRVPMRRLLVTCLLIVVMAAALYLPITARVNEGVSDLHALEQQNYGTSLGQRLVMWKAGLSLIGQKPLLGYGPANLPQLMQARTNALFGLPLHFTHFHNMIMTQWIRGGLLGALVVPVLFLLMPYLARRRIKGEAASYGFALLVALELIYLSSGLFGIMFGHDILDTVFISLSAIALYFVFSQGSVPKGYANPA